MAKRANGEGTMQKVVLKSGKVKWRYRKEILLANGEAKRLSATRPTQREARDAVAELEKSYAKYDADLTVRQAYQEYEKVLPSLVKKTTINQAIRPAFKHRILPKWGEIRLMDLRRRDIQLWVSDELAKSDTLRTHTPLSETAIRKIVGVFSAFLSWCVGERWLDTNPCTRISVPKRAVSLAEENREKMLKDEDYLPLDEMQDFLSEISIPDKYSAKNVILLILYTGCRPGEALGLTWDAIKRDRIQIRRTLAERGGDGIELQSVKTAASNRDFPLTDNLAEIISEQKSFQKAQKVHFLRDFQMAWKPALNLVFTRADGSPISEKVVSDQVKKACKACGFLYSDGKTPKILHPHALRHTFCTVMVDEGILTLEECSRYLGHTSVATTQQFYHRGSTSAMLKTGEKAAALFEKSNADGLAERGQNEAN